MMRCFGPASRCNCRDVRWSGWVAAALEMKGTHRSQILAPPRHAPPCPCRRDIVSAPRPPRRMSRAGRERKRKESRAEPRRAPLLPPPALAGATRRHPGAAVVGICCNAVAIYYRPHYGDRLTTFQVIIEHCTVTTHLHCRRRLLLSCLSVSQSDCQRV